MGDFGTRLISIRHFQCQRLSALDGKTVQQQLVDSSGCVMESLLRDRRCSYTHPGLNSVVFIPALAILRFPHHWDDAPPHDVLENGHRVECSGRP